MSRALAARKTPTHSDTNSPGYSFFYIKLTKSANHSHRHHHQSNQQLDPHRLGQLKSTHINLHRIKCIAGNNFTHLRFFLFFKDISSHNLTNRVG